MPKVRVIPKDYSYGMGDPFCMVRVAAYARVSTDNMEQETSYETQVKYYTDCINSRPGWEIVGVYADKGISGLSTKNRTEFNRMIADAKAKKIDLILVKSVSRFSRNIVDALEYIRLLKTFNVRVLFEKENLDSFDSKAETLLSIMATLAQEESRSMSENIRWGIKRNMERGKVFLPYSRFLGYKRSDNGEILINKEEAKIVREIYELYLSGKSSNWIAKTLTENNIPTPSGKKVWSDSVITSILTNEKYTGDALLQKTYTKSFLDKKNYINRGEMPQYYVSGSHPAIIDKETFKKVQEVYKTRSLKIKLVTNENEFVGRLICAQCDTRLAKINNHEECFWQCRKCGKKVNIQKIRDGFLLAINNVYNDKMQETKNLSEKLSMNKNILLYCKEKLKEAENKYNTIVGERSDGSKSNDSVLREKALFNLKQAKKNHKDTLRENKEIKQILKVLNNLNDAPDAYSPEVFRGCIYGVIVEDDELDFLFYGGREQNVANNACVD